MAQRLYNDEKIKLLLLYMLKELDTKLDFQTISEIIVWDGSISYFVFVECFNELVEQGVLKKETNENGKEVFFLSPEGVRAVESIEDNLIEFSRKKIMKSATRLLAFKFDGSSIATEVDKDHEGYQLTCTIKNKKFDLMQLKLYLDNKEEVDLLKSGFENRADHIYGTILSLLSGDTKFLF